MSRKISHQNQTDNDIDLFITKTTHNRDVTVFGKLTPKNKICRKKVISTILILRN
jgi:hypothetical protein